MKKAILGHHTKAVGWLLAFCFGLVLCTYGQTPLSLAVKAKLQKLYDGYRPSETTFESFAEVNRHLFEGKAKGQTGANINTKIGCNALNSLCGNGDFESGSISTAEWSGGYGTQGGGQPNPYALNDGFISGPINNFNSHQTIVGVGPDPTVPIQQVAADGGSYALRLGNQVNNYGTEYVSKTFVVTADKAIFPFRYALVFEDPGHAPNDQPAFSVRAFDCSGNELPNVCDLGNGSNIAISKASDPFFTSAAGGSIAYKDWSQAQINLSAYVGQTVTVVWLNKDCGLGGHWGYTYLDNLCVVCTSGCPYNLSVNTASTTTCGAGQICLDYALPSTGGNTGSLVIDLDVYQNGVKVGATQSSPVLTSGTSYCFNINPTSLGLNASVNGFDYAVTGHFVINGFPLSPIFVGNPFTGQVPGQNNDYSTLVPSCSIASIPSDNTYTGGNPNNLYIGYGPQSTTLKVTPSGGSSFTYQWVPATGLSNATSAAPLFTPPGPGTYVFTVTVKNEFGCSTTCGITICVLDVRVPGSNGKKVYVCHTPPGNPANANTLSISVNAVPAHIFSPGHGDHLGTCDQVPCGSARVVSAPFIVRGLATASEATLSVSAVPNPSAGSFRLLVRSDRKEPVNISIANIYGRVVFLQTNVSPGATIDVGGNFAEGTYYVEVKQGEKTSLLKLFKTK